jgi:WD40 repeat protein
MWNGIDERPASLVVDVTLTMLVSFKTRCADAPGNRALRETAVARRAYAAPPLVSRGVVMSWSHRFVVAAAALASPGVALHAQTLHASLQRTFSHAGIGRQIAFSPDSRVLATSSADGSITLRRVADGVTLRTITHPNGATSIAFTRDGATLISAGYDATVRLWRVSDGAPVRTLTGHRKTVWTVSASPDGQTMASAGEDSTVRLWRIADGAPLRTLRGHTRNVWSVDFSPDGRRLASSSFDATVKLWNVDTGALERTLTDASEAVVHVAFSPDGAVVAGSGDDSAVWLWRVSDGSLVRVLTGGSSHIYSVEFSPDGQWLATGGRGQSAIATFWKQIAGYRLSPKGKTVRLWRLRDGALLSVLADHVDDVWSLAFSPDGQWLATASEEGTVNLYRLRPR